MPVSQDYLELFTINEVRIQKDNENLGKLSEVKLLNSLGPLSIHVLVLAENDDTISIIIPLQGVDQIKTTLTVLTTAHVKFSDDARKIMTVLGVTDNSVLVISELEKDTSTKDYIVINVANNIQINNLVNYYNIVDRCTPDTMADLIEIQRWSTYLTELLTKFFPEILPKLESLPNVKRTIMSLPYIGNVIPTESDLASELLIFVEAIRRTFIDAATIANEEIKYTNRLRAFYQTIHISRADYQRRIYDVYCTHQLFISCPEFRTLVADSFDY